MSIVVCSYNRADRLGATLNALERQTIRDRLEIVIVDDGSIPSIDESEVRRSGAGCCAIRPTRAPLQPATPEQLAALRPS